MLEFFTTVMIITGGVFCLAIWAGITAVILVELWDRVTGYDRKPTVILEEEDF